MRKMIFHLIGAVISCILIQGYAAAQSPITPPKIGETVGDFNLKSVDGKPLSLAHSKGSKGTLLIFMATRCPYSNAFVKVMEQLNEQYSAQGIQVIGINSNKTDPYDDVVAHARQNGLKYPILKDEGNVIADKLGAQVTPEAYLLDNHLKLQYHGALGNSKDPSTDSAKANGDEVKAALDALLGGKPVSAPETKAFGCTIKR
jgi:peroxiredoxin